jgi:ketosteroid isomerase-like protein
MSQENVELVRSIYRDWERGDWSSVAWADPEIEFVMADGPETGRVTGVAEMGRSWSGRLRPWEDFQVRPEEYRELDDGRVLAFTRGRGRGKTSEVIVEDRGANIFEFRDGKVAKLTIYFDRANALADLGLEEQAMSENLDLVRSIYADWERGDYSRIDWADPEIECEFVDGATPGVTNGLGEMARTWADVLSSFDEFRTKATEFRELDDERVLVLAEAIGSAKRSHMPIPDEWGRGANVFRVSDGKVVGLRTWFDRANALADLGLTE